MEDRVEIIIRALHPLEQWRSTEAAARAVIAALARESETDWSQDD